jgi:hypothetical protein
MKVHSQLFVTATLTVALLAACGQREEQESAVTQPAPASDTADATQASGKTTTFEEPTSEPKPQQ